jgi:hypothetical protein
LTDDAGSAGYQDFHYLSFLLPRRRGHAPHPTN